MPSDNRIRNGSQLAIFKMTIGAPSICAFIAVVVVVVVVSPSLQHVWIVSIVRVFLYKLSGVCVLCARFAIYTHHSIETHLIRSSNLAIGASEGKIRKKIQQQHTLPITWWQNGKYRTYHRQQNHSSTPCARSWTQTFYCFKYTICNNLMVLQMKNEEKRMTLGCAHFDANTWLSHLSVDSVVDRIQL